MPSLKFLTGVVAFICCFISLSNAFQPSNIKLRTNQNHNQITSSSSFKLDHNNNPLEQLKNKVLQKKHQIRNIEDKANHSDLEFKKTSEIITGRVATVAFLFMLYNEASSGTSFIQQLESVQSYGIFALLSIMSIASILLSPK